jgi:hypothetical protein
MNFDSNKDYGFSTSVTNFPGSDFKTDWNTIGDYSDLFGKPYDSDSTESGDDKWKNALSKGLSWLASSDKNKYRSKAEESNPSNRFASGGGSLQPLGKDSVIWMPSQGQPITVAGGQSSGGGLGSALGSAAGFAAGMLIPGAQHLTPQLMALGGNIGGSIG